MDIHNQLQKHLHKQISNLTQNNNEPWLLIGDLNEIFSSNEKWPAHQGGSTRSVKFNKFT